MEKSFTFITISVMSVLSDSSVIIYWENIVKKKLIEPMWSCFHSYTTYSFATVIFGGIAALIGLPFVSLIFFVIDILVLMALTFSMIDVYFRHEEKAVRLEKEFLKLVLTEDAPIEVIRQNYEKYLKITAKLRTNTILALKYYDSPTIEENFKFYARNAAYIPKRDFEAIMKCVDEINISDYTEWYDYYARISYQDGQKPDYQAQMLIGDIMCRGTDLFHFIFAPHILPLFAKYSDSVSTESIFCDYKEYMKKQRDVLKKTLLDQYDRREHSPAASNTRTLLLSALLEVAKSGNRDFLMVFLHSFEETNMLSNYDYIESEEYIWEDYFKTIPEDEAYDTLHDIYPITEILYGTNRPECVERACASVWGDYDEITELFRKEEGSFSYSDEEYRSEGEELMDIDPDDIGLEEDNYEDDGTGYESEEDSCEDDWAYYCKLYGQEYMGWPPENDHNGIFTYAGSLAYHMSSQHAEMMDGDLPEA